jgi:predicted Zn-dependent peptidase
MRASSGGRVAIVGVVMLLACTAVSGTAPRAGAQAITLAPRPAAPQPIEFRFPAVVSRRLPNGLTLVVSENHTLPVVAVRAVVRADSTDDFPTLHGLADVVQRAIGQASMHYSAERLADTLASLGVSLTATSFTTRTASLRPALAIMADLLIAPVFSEDAVSAAKAGVLQARRAVDNAPAFMGRELLYDSLLGQDAAYNRRPSVASIEAIRATDLTRFQRMYYVPWRTTLVMVGDITLDQAVREAEAQFGGWTGATDVARAAKWSTPREGPTTIYLVDRPGAKQSTIVFGSVGPLRGDPEFAAASAFTALFGGTSSSRLPHLLRQEHAWAYTAASRVDARGLKDPTVLWSTADVAAEKTDSALVESLAELRKAGADTAITQEDLQSARNMVIGTVQRIIATDDGLAGRLADLAESNLPLDYYTRLSSSLGELRPADIQRAAAAFANPDHLVVVVVGNRASIEAGLRATGLPVVVVPASAP